MTEHDFLVAATAMRISGRTPFDRSLGMTWQYASAAQREQLQACFPDAFAAYAHHTEPEPYS